MVHLYNSIRFRHAHCAVRGGLSQLLHSYSMRCVVHISFSCSPDESALLFQAIRRQCQLAMYKLSIVLTHSSEATKVRRTREDPRQLSRHDAHGLRISRCGLDCLRNRMGTHDASDVFITAI